MTGYLPGVTTATVADKTMLPPDCLALAPVRRPTRCDVVRPSELTARDIQVWHEIVAHSAIMQRPFFVPAFALACERAGCRVYVAVLSDEAGICGFMPFQFSSAWHERLGLAERVGGNLSQGACLVAWPSVRLTSESLMRLCGLSLMHVTQLMEGQEEFGLDAAWSQICYVTDLACGADEYFADLLTRDRGFVRDSERQLRRAEKTLGPLSLDTSSPVTNAALAGIIAAKRQQYQRTQAADPFDRRDTLAIIEALNAAPSPECHVVLTRLQAGEQTLAQHLGVQYHGALSWWFPVYDPGMQGVSPGRLLLWYVIRRAADHGITSIEYGEGDAAYKRQFSTGSIKMGRALWSAHTGRAYVARAWQTLDWRLGEWRGGRGKPTPGSS